MKAVSPFAQSTMVMASPAKCARSFNCQRAGMPRSQKERTTRMDAPRDVVKGLRRTPLKGAWRIHRGRGRRALEPRSLLNFWQEIAWNGRDVMVENKGAQASELISRGRDQSIDGWMLRTYHLQHRLDRRCWIDVPSRLG
jgi:hypothetical protein